ncbi:Hypothetical protein R9X50_00449100 [Acrodontium crateriforme]|uniref:Uncharacterized protein n=1 Tax=Acrodontium crateriforme TaxID=150365 RepID=A0AAQ3R540_9PEZI|nr:Hypothetical protein R9X50_00449100 [Acrodontium crateriforme]
MLGLSRAFHTAACASCRLRATISAKLFARSRRYVFPALQQRREFSGSMIWNKVKNAGSRDRLNTFEKEQAEYERVRTMMADEGGSTQEDANRDDLLGLDAIDVGPDSPLTTEEIVQVVRKAFGDSLPEGLLNEEQYLVYERLYGKPLPTLPLSEELIDGEDIASERLMGTTLIREGQDGELEEVEISEVEEEMDGFEDERALQDEPGKKVKFTFDDMKLARDMEAAFSREQHEQSLEAADEEEHGPRAHHLTVENRFGPSPSTVYLPKETFVDPATILLSGMPSVHLTDAAHRTFGGVGLPYSASTPNRAKTMQQKPIALDAQQNGMSPIEGDVYMAAVMPAVFASVTSVLAETRKRLGTQWAEDIVKKAMAGQLRILDAGGAGAGILAVREVLRAEWERMNEDSSTSLAQADGKVGGANASPPLGLATVLAGSNVLRKRASQLLDNTTFIPRLPDYIHAENAPATGKFDIIIAPHTLWPLREDYMRKRHMQNLWSMLSTEAGVLLLLEKGMPRGFELIAAARDMLLDDHIASPGSETAHIRLDEPAISWEGEAEDEISKEPRPSTRAKNAGMIIAPCTNHEPCPMYQPKGLVKGRKSLCQFQQRYIRPPFLQKILGARDKNFEDIEFSYLSVMRGRDLRTSKNLVQSEEANEQAFVGYADAESATPHSLTLPRLVLPPIKRRGHVIFDVCTSAGTLERWTVPRSFGKQAFRDARKAAWGDLWALGAKTRIARQALVSKHTDKGDLDIKATRVRRTGPIHGESLARSAKGPGVDDDGRLVFGGETKPEKTGRGDGGKMRTGKVKGIRDKRDKKGTGNGRGRNRDVEG